MLQANLGLDQLCEQQTEIISADPVRTPSSLHLSKHTQYSPQPTRRPARLPVIILLLILIFYVSLSLLNVRGLVTDTPAEGTASNVGVFRQQQVQGDEVLPVLLKDGLGNHSRRIQLAKEAYISAKDAMVQLPQGAQMGQVDGLLKAKYELQALLAQERPDPAALQALQNGQSDLEFKLPSTVWTYLTRPLQKQSYINSLTISNNIRIAKTANCSLILISRHNYRDYLSHQAAEELERAIAVAGKSGERSSEDLQHVVKYLVMVAILEEVGGVFVEEYVSLLEGFQWLSDIANNIFVNRGARNVQPQVVAFHSVDHSSPMIRQEKPEVVQVKQYMRLFPAVAHYFLAAPPRTPFITALKLQLWENIRKTNQEIVQITHELHKSKAFKLPGNLWADLFTISSQQVLVREQERLQQTNSATLFAIDSYGLKTVNEFYFPYKLEFIFTKYQFEKTYTHLAKHSLSELETTVGPLRYVAVITPRGDVDYLLERARDGYLESFIFTGSFLQTFLFNGTAQTFIIDNPQKPQTRTHFPKWTKLPKIVWLFWDKGISSSHATNQLAKRNIERYANPSGFRVIEVNQTNLKNYIGLAEIERIEESLYFNNRGSKYDQTYSDLVRLALLKKHGGVYMDASFVLLQDLSWLLDIAAYPSQYVFNRYGELPSIFMFFNPHYGSPYDEWQVDVGFNTKAHWHLSYENNFIACEPRNELIIAWYNDLLNYLSQPYSQTELQFTQCGIAHHKWSSPENTYLLPMDAIKCVVGRKEKELVESGKTDVVSPASQYYRLWSISGYNGVQKFRGMTNFQSPGSDDNLFFRRYSEHYASSLLGKPRELIKLYGLNNLYLNEFIRDNLEARIFHEFHYRSFFNKYLFSLRDDDQDFLIINDNLLVKEKQSE